MAGTRFGRKLRRLVFGAAWCVMTATAVWYLLQYRDFMVDDRLYDAEIRAAAAKHGLDSRLVRAVVYQESRFRPGTVGRAGEIGLMQIMPDQAARDWARANRVPVPERAVLFSPRLNLEIGCWYLADGMRRFGGYREATLLALARYNAGLTRAKAWAPEKPDGAVLPRIAIASTRRYVEQIMNRYRKYCEETDSGAFGGKP